MKYDKLEFNGTYNSKGDPIYLATNVIKETRFDQSEIEKIIVEVKGEIEKCTNAIKSAELNILMNQPVINIIKTQDILTDEQIGAGEKYFRNVIELKRLQLLQPKQPEELAKWEEVLQLIKNLDVQKAIAYDTTTNSGGEVGTPTGETGESAVQ